MMVVGRLLLEKIRLQTWIESSQVFIPIEMVTDHVLRQPEFARAGMDPL